MEYLVVVLSIALTSSGLLLLSGREAVLRIKSMDGDVSGDLSKPERVAAGITMLFVGALLGLSAYSTIVSGDPYWFLDSVFGLFS